MAKGPFSKIEELLKTVQTAEERLGLLTQIKEECDILSSIVKKEYPRCPECNLRYRLDSYRMEIKDEEYKNRDRIWLKKILYMECPRGHMIRLGDCDKFGYRRDEVLSQEKMDKIVKCLNEIDYGAME